MRVMVPFATLYPETRAALEADGREADYVPVGAAPTAYYDAMKRYWASGEGFIVVEQDIVPWLGALAELEACDQGWCGFAYELSVGWGAYLGCTRFSTRLVSEHSGVLEAVGNLPPDGTPPRYWQRLDTRMKRVLEDNEQQQMHIHWPAVGHLNPAQQFNGAYHYPCGHEVPRTVLNARPWPYGQCVECGR